MLLTGESGTGKEVVARFIHQGSRRKHGPFVAINCAALPDQLLESELFGHERGSFTGAHRDKAGLVSQAEGGTLFLDELGEMSPRMQAVLLRFAETGEVQPVGAVQPKARVDVRMIAATNRDLRLQIVDGKFREDLYYRLNVIQLHVPPLRERATDVPLLLRHFLERASAEHRLPCPVLSPEAEAALRGYAWPGNVRELKNLAESLVVRDKGVPIMREDLPLDLGPAPGTFAAPDAPAAMGPPVGASTGADEWTRQCAPVADILWQKMVEGDSFWTVAASYKAHDLTRSDLRKLIHIALKHTRGNYQGVLRVFNLPEHDYKRFQSFLFQHRCHLPVRWYRDETSTASAGRFAPLRST